MSIASRTHVSVELQGGTADLEQHDAGGDREVKRIRPAGLGDAQQPVAALREFVRQALLLVAHEEQNRSALEVDRTVVDRALEMGAGDDAGKALPPRQERLLRGLR